MSTAWFISPVRVPEGLREGYGICRDGTNIQQEQLGGSIAVQHCGRGPDLKSPEASPNAVSMLILILFIKNSYATIICAGKTMLTKLS